VGVQETVQWRSRGISGHFIAALYQHPIRGSGFTRFPEPARAGWTVAFVPQLFKHVERFKERPRLFSAPHHADDTRYAAAGHTGRQLVSRVPC
jgi:hypothetical protein